MNILVTGASGQLGNCIHELCAQDGTHLNHWFFVNRSQLDISDRDSVKKYINEIGVDIVVNCAAYTDVEGAEENYNTAFDANVIGPLNIAMALEDREGILIHISTDYVYAPFPGWDGSPFKENQCALHEDLSPLNFYGETKLRGEKEIISTNCRHLIIRTSWLYSEHGKNFVKTVRNLIKNSGIDDTFRFVCDQIGTPTSAHSLASFIYNFANALGIRNDLFQNFKSDVVNYSDNGACSWYDFAMEINDIMGMHATILPCYTWEYPTKAKRPHYSVMSKEKIKNDELYLPYVNTVHWKQGVRNVMKRLEI